MNRHLTFELHWVNVINEGFFRTTNAQNSCTHIHGLVSVFGICAMKSIKAKLSLCQISFFQLDSVAEKMGLSFG